MELFLKRKVDIKEAALNWFLSVYTPAVQCIVEKGLEDVYQGKTLGDIFALFLIINGTKVKKRVMISALTMLCKDLLKKFLEKRNLRRRKP